MLAGLRKSAGSWVAWIFIIPLVLGFGLWGIGDVFRGYGSRNVATVGDVKISQEEYRSALQAQLRGLGQQFGRSLTLSEGRALGIDRQVLESMIREAILANQARDMRLGISDKAIAQRIIEEPAWRGTSGKFSQLRFEQFLQANGLTEAGFVARQRDVLVRRQIVSTVGGAVYVPATFLRAADIYRNETRKLKYFILPVSKLDPLEEPTGEVLQKYYEASKARYTAPEYRKLGVLALLADTVAKSIAIPEKELKAYYDSQSGAFRQPERRTISQIPFPDQATAQAAYDKIEAGASFEDIAKERGISEEDRKLGTLAKADLVDKVIAEAAFKLSKDEVSKPVKGQLSTVLLLVTAIEPEKVTSFEEAKPKISATLAKQRASEKILDLHDKIVDERAAGATLADIAKTLNLEYTVIPAVDRKGLGPDDKPMENVPDKRKLLGEAFSTEVGADTDPIETTDQSLIWFEVIEVVPAKLKPFAQVRDQVAKDWRADEERKRLAKKAQEIVGRARKGEKLDDLASALGLEVKESAPVKRDGKTEALPRAAVAQAFVLSQGGYGSAPTVDGQGRIVFEVAAVEQPGTLDKEAADALRKSLTPQIAEDLLVQYINGLGNGYGVTRNQPLIDQITGRER